MIRIIGDGRPFIDFQVSPTIDEGGRVSEIVASAFDVFERVAQSERLEELLHEMGHWIGNLLGKVQAMARLTKQTSVRDEAFPHFRVRLDAPVAPVGAWPRAAALVRGRPAPGALRARAGHQRS